MANVIYIELVDTNIAFKAQLQEDPTIEAASQFSTFGDMLPQLRTVSDLLSMGQSTLNGKVTEGLINATNALNIPRWQSTDPLKISTSLTFYTMENAYNDVWYPANLIMNMGILSYNPNDNSFITPGVSLKSMPHLKKLNDQALKRVPPSARDELAIKQKNSLPSYGDFPSTAKLCSILIPGIVYLDVAYVFSCQPTFSKQKTSDGYPLWARLECTFSSLYPANDKMLQNAVNMGISRIKAPIKSYDM